MTKYECHGCGKIYDDGDGMPGQCCGKTIRHIVSPREYVITINVDADHTPEEALQEVLRIVRDTGCTRGIDPTFDIVEENHD